MRLLAKFLIIPVILFLINPLYAELAVNQNDLNVSFKHPEEDGSLQSYFEQKYSFLNEESITPANQTPVDSAQPVSKWYQNQGGFTQGNIRQQIAHFEKLRKGTLQRALIFFFGSPASLGLATLAYDNEVGGSLIILIGMPVFLIFSLVNLGRGSYYAHKIKILKKRLRLSIGPSLSPRHIGIGVQIEF